MAFDSLYVGVTGLNAYQNQIDVISNNIANVGTNGFKGQDVNFQDLIYQQQSYATAPTNTTGGVNGQSVGLGVKIGSISTDFTQGGLQTTGVNTDLAINGNGFFILRGPNGSSQPTYTRNGAFSLNANGLLYDPSSGLAVQGYTASQNGKITQTGTPNDITIPLGLQAQAVGTGLNANQKFGPTGDSVFDVAMGGNLDQTQWIKEAQGVQAGAAGAGSPYTISTTIYDSLGNAHLAQITYTPDATGATLGPPASSGLPATVTNANGTATAVSSRWKVNVSFADGSTFNAIATPGNGAVAPTYAAASSGTVGYVYFDQNGQFVNTSSYLAGTGAGAPLTAAQTHSANAKAAAVDGNELDMLTWNTGNTNNATTPTGTGAAGTPTTGPIGLDFHSSTGLSATSSANVLSQNGYAAGILSNITVGADGTVTGAFTNGQTITLAQVALANFQNEGGLERIGQSQFAQTANSGLAQVGTGTTGNYGSIVSGSLEQSNVSIADQFTKMISAQNAYQANSKSITVASEDMQTLTNLIR